MACFLPCPDLGTNLIVSKEEFFSFHNIDRQLFTRLVVVLGRDTSQSTHVMAFIMWLEKQCKDMKMIKNMLQWSDTMIDSLADEVILVFGLGFRIAFYFIFCKIFGVFNECFESIFNFVP